jgi:hypothetical protein
MTGIHAMTNSIVGNFHAFRNKIYNFFKYRADSTLDLIDSIAGQQSKESTVKLSLSNLFRRKYSSLTDVVDNLFRREANTNLEIKELQEEQFKMTTLLMEECPQPVSRPFELFAVDCSSTARIYAKKLEDRGFVHSPTKVPGQKPITVGHQYSTVVYIPEKSKPSDPHWVMPLSTQRVKSECSGTILGMDQIIQITTSDKFKSKLCVSANDSAYSNYNCLNKANEIVNLVNISRLRNNRGFHLTLAEVEGPKPVGRPKVYGDRWKLSDPGEPNENITVSRYTASGKLIHLCIERWIDRQEKKRTVDSDSSPVLTDLNSTDTSKTPLSDENIKNASDDNRFLFDAVRVTVLKEDGTALYKKPLWLMVTGKRRQELSLADIADSYFRRFDIEHFFRFSKQKLLLASFQTPDVRHEENWWWLCIISYSMLYQGKSLAHHVRNPWEKKQKNLNSNGLLTPSQVQRDYERIIGEIGTPACDPKPRGNPKGRVKGTKVDKRKDYNVIRKTKKAKKKISKAAA